MWRTERDWNRSETKSACERGIDSRRSAVGNETVATIREGNVAATGRTGAPLSRNRRFPG